MHKLLSQASSFLALVALVSLGCGGGNAGGAHHPKDDHAHGPMTPALHAFHEVLAPAWHSKPGQERIAKACAVDKELVEKAKATQDSSLFALVSSMQKECEDPTRDEVEAWFGKVHERFHQLSDK